MYDAISEQKGMAFPDLKAHAALYISETADDLFRDLADRIFLLTRWTFKICPRL